MSNAFAHHGITHLSASSLNQFAASPAAFVMERLLKKRTLVGCSAHRGTAAEAGISHGLLHPEALATDCQAIAEREYARLTALSGDPKREKEGAAVAPIVAIALAELRQYGVPDRVQEKITREIPGIPVPLIGYLDFGWSQHGIVVDLKTSLRLASSISNAHARQVAGYIQGTNNEARVCYATPQKIGVYRLEDAAHHWAAVCNIAHRLNRFLSISSKPSDLAAFVVPDLEDIRFSEPVARAMALETFGPL